MSNASISQRLHYRVVPEEASEPTSTIVLTSPENHFVDIRVFKQADDDHGKGRTGPLDSSLLDWAFVGHSRTSSLPLKPGQKGPQSHTIWNHWVDSKTDTPGPDEGDMTDLDDGTVLEQGSSKDVKTGTVIEYEELWTDLPIEPVGANSARSCIVLVGKSQGKVVGMAIRLGTWCQGMLKAGQTTTVERWEALEEHAGSDWEWVKRFSIGMPAFRAAIFV